MNFPVRLSGGRPGNATVALAPIPASVVLGMPHLCFNGLSETWLLKECGHRHWFALAAQSGRAVPDFRDGRGAPVYAAFVAVQIRGARFDAVGEHDELHFTSRLHRVSGTRFTSVHHLTVRGALVGEVILSSVFVTRTEAGRNRSIVRTEIPGFPPAAVMRAADPAAEVMSLRRGDWDEHLGFRRASAAEIHRLVVDPCPAQDFNGADFLYFAGFQALADRAEWAFFRPHPRTTTRRRDIVYFGNIEVGERVAVLLLQQTNDAGRLAHWCRIIREDDSAPLADVFTLRG